MKSIVTACLLALSGTAIVAQSGCAAPTERVTEVRTLQYAGITAKAALDTAAQLLKAGKITVPQYQDIASIDDKFHLVYDPAVAAVQANLSSIASPAVLDALYSLTQAINQLSK